jgi:hypothetical protein
MGLVLDVGNGVPPLRYQVRRLEEVAGEDALVIRVTHTAKAVYCYKEDAEDTVPVQDMVPIVRVQHASVELVGLIDEPVRPPVEQSPVEILQTLVEYTTMYGTGVPAVGVGADEPGDDDGGLEPLDCFQILDTGLSQQENPDGLGPKSTPAQIKDAITAIMNFMAKLEARGNQYGILGSGTNAAALRTTNFQRTLLRMQLAYGAALSIINLRAAQQSDYDVSRVNHGGYSVVAASSVPTMGPRGMVTPRVKPEVVLMDKVLQYCALNSLRHVKRVVYVEQRVPPSTNLRWRTAKCVECGKVSMSVMYARRDTRDLLCIRHALEAVEAGGHHNVENVVFQCAANHRGQDLSPEMRMATAGKPLWRVNPRQSATQTGTKTWVPDLRSPAAGEDVLGAEQPDSTADLVRRVLDRRMYDRNTWETYLGNKGMVEHLASHLAESSDPAFPHHTPKTLLFAFANGVYAVQEGVSGVFYTHDELPQSHGEAGAINFINEFFDPMWTVQPLDTLAVPGYDDILRTQNYTADSVAFLDALLGRQLFKAGVLDDWAVAPVLLGTAGSGKSTIAKALMMLVREQNVGLLPSNCEEQYAVASLVGKVMVMCTEMKEGFKLPLSVLLCMITGDPVSVHAKYKDVFDKSSWDSHVMLMGNVIPLSWLADPGGSMERRAMVFRLDTKPATQDPTIQNRFFQNLGPFLVRITRSYKELAVRVKEANRQGKFFRNFMPRQVASFQAMFKSQTSVSAAFLDHLMQSYDVGFVNVQPIALPQDEELMELFKYMREAVMPGGTLRFPGLDFKQEVIQNQVQAAGLGRHMTLDQFQAAVKQFRVPFKQLEALFSQWWRDTNPAGRGAGSAKVPSVVGTLDEIGLVVSTDASHHPASTRFVFGLRARPDDQMLLDGMM